MKIKDHSKHNSIYTLRDIDNDAIRALGTLNISRQTQPADNQCFEKKSPGFLTSTPKKIFFAAAFVAFIFMMMFAGAKRISAQTITVSATPNAAATPTVTAAPAVSVTPVTAAAPIPSPTPVATPTPYSVSNSSVQANSFTSGAAVPATSSYFKNSAAFRQEIARLEINVAREGSRVLPITQVPRLQKGDVIKVRLLEEAVGGIKPDQSNWDWTFLVAFVNPNRNVDQKESVSDEIRFRRTGWYKEYSFIVPYDSQPVFFLYPKPKYRDKILKIISKKYEEVQKLGDKTIEIAGAYAQIGSFLNELQGVLTRTQASAYGPFVTYPVLPNTANGTRITSGNLTGIVTSITNSGKPVPEPIYNYSAFFEQTIERLAQSFNIQLPACWQTASGGITYNGSNIYGNGSLSGSKRNLFGYAVSQDLIGRAQCVAKNIRIEDFDLSVSRLLKEGGIFALTQLRDKYPQFAYWINLAAAAIDFIVKAFQKSPLKIVPTIFSTANLPANSANPAQSNAPQNPVKISLFAESQPTDQGAVTAYPVVVQKWEAETDPGVITLPPPVLLEPCLHAGQNILKSTNLLNDSVSDTFTKDVKLILSAPSGFKKELPLKQNIGLGGWELNITGDDFGSLTKTAPAIEAELAGTRGFNEIRSPKFSLPLAVTGTWQIKPESQKTFAVGEKRSVVLQNLAGGCRCLQSVTFKPAASGQLLFEANSKENPLQFSSDGKYVSFDIDTGKLPPGAGQLEIKIPGAQVVTLPLKLYPAPPKITDVKIAKGDNQAAVTGERLEQIHFIRINGKAAKESASGNSEKSLTGEKMKNEKIFVFEDRQAKQTDKTVSLELGLEDDRIYRYPQTFTASPARPAVIATAADEIEAIPVKAQNDKNERLALSSILAVPVTTPEISLTARNKLTDYDFKQENISVETRIENSDSAVPKPAEVSFEVLDSNTLRLKFTLSDELQKYLGGRRLQFKIKDSARGDSGWYTIKQTFVRVPKIDSITCADKTKGPCEIRGTGLEHISGFSIDEGVTWFPDKPGQTAVQEDLPDGSQKISITAYPAGKKLLIKLRDYPNEAIPVRF